MLNNRADAYAQLINKLWKGKRDEALELSVIDAVASRLGMDRWDVFAQLDSVFEDIAARAERNVSAAAGIEPDGWRTHATAGDLGDTVGGQW